MAAYGKLKESLMANFDFMLEKFHQLAHLINHPQVTGPKLDAACAKITRIKDWVRNVSDHVKMV